VKAAFFHVVAALGLLSGCAMQPPAPPAPREIPNPDNGFEGIVDKQGRPANATDVAALRAVARDGKHDPLRAPYAWFYTHNQTFAQHLDAWAYRFGYRFIWLAPTEDDRVVLHDGSSVGDLFSAISDLAALTPEGKASFEPYRGVQRLRTLHLQVTVFENDRVIRVERRDPENERAEQLHDAQAVTPGIGNGS
jgi:hypothetical protein